MSLHLAREQEAGALARPHRPTSAHVQAPVMREFQEAWGGRRHRPPHRPPDRRRLLTMPPIDVRVEGAEAVGAFFATEPLGGRLDRIALVPARASR